MSNWTVKDLQCTKKRKKEKSNQHRTEFPLPTSLHSNSKSPLHSNSSLHSKSSLQSNSIHSNSSLHSKSLLHSKSSLHSKALHSKSIQTKNQSKSKTSIQAKAMNYAGGKKMKRGDKEMDLLPVQRSIPMQFLKRNKKRTVLRVRAVDAIFRVVEGNHRQCLFTAVYRWKIKVNREKVVERDEAVGLYRLLSGLSNCIGIVLASHQRRMGKMMNRWRRNTIKVRNAVFRGMAIRIQCRWRQRVAYRVYRKLKLRKWRLERKIAAKVMQRNVRGWLGRRKAKRRRRYLLEWKSAWSIQHASRLYIGKCRFQDRKELVAAMLINRMVRGALGRHVAALRKIAYWKLANVLYTICCETSLIKCTKIHYASVMIQRSYTTHVVRDKVLKNLKLLWKRKRYHPAQRIQQFWHTCRNRLLRSKINWISSVIQFTNDVAARKFQVCFRAYALRKRIAAATNMQRIARSMLARLEFSIRQTQQIFKIALDARLANLVLINTDLPDHQLDLSIIKRRAIYITLIKAKLKTHRNAAATNIQRIIRGYLGCKYAVRLQIARIVINRSVPLLAWRIIVGKRRKKVLARWKSKRRHILRPVFKFWKGFTSATKDELVTKRNYEYRRLAVWHWKIILLKPVMSGLIQYYRYRQAKHRQTKKAYMHLSKVSYGKWSFFVNVAVVRDTVQSMLLVMYIFPRWRRKAHFLKLTRFGALHYQSTLRCKHFRYWKDYRLECHRKMALAVRFSAWTSCYAVFTSFYNYINRMQFIKQFDLWNQKQRGISELTYARSCSYLAEKQLQNALQFDVTRLYKSSIRKLLNYSMKRQRNRIRNEKLLIGFLYVQKWQSVNRWAQRTKWTIEYKRLDKSADIFYRKVLLRLGYRLFFVLWEHTAGAPKRRAATLVRAAWLGMQQRKLFLPMLVFDRYQVETRVKHSNDLHKCHADNFHGEIKANQWLVVLFYVAWEFPSNAYLKEVRLAATRLRRYQPLKFLLVDASQRNANSTTLGHQYRLSSGLPGLYMIWKGRSGFLKNAKDKYSVIGTKYGGKPTATKIVQWFESKRRLARHLTAIQIQARAKGYMYRRYLWEQRVLLENNTSTQIKRWYFYRKDVQCIGRANRASFYIQRWFAKRQWTIGFKKDLLAFLCIYRPPVLCIQRAIRSYLVRQIITRLIEEKNATPDKYPKAPLCCECEDVLALIKCTDCEDPFCENCFARLHAKGARSIHRCVGIDFRSMHENRLMCPVCEVQETRCLCLDCAQPYCMICYEIRHTNLAGKIVHAWRSALLPVLEYTASRGIHADEVVTKHGWKTQLQNIIRHKAEAAAKIAQEKYEAELEAFKVQNQEIVREAFEKYDEDKSGWIDCRELKKMLIEELCEPITDKEIIVAMKTIDLDGNGKIEFDELLTWFSQEMLKGKSNAKLNLLRKKLQAKRKIRRIKEAIIPPKEVVEVFPMVPGHATVDLITKDAFKSKKKVFLRYLQDDCKLDWIFTDHRKLGDEKLQQVFENVFIYHWNAGDLGYEFYYDGLTFLFENAEWQCNWDIDSRRYIYKNITKDTLCTGDPRIHTRVHIDAKKAFEDADRDGSGEIDTKEFYKMMRTMLFEPITREQASIIMRQVDIDESGSITFTEFFTWYHAEQSQNYAYSAAHEGLRNMLQNQNFAKNKLRQASRVAAKHSKVIFKKAEKKLQKARIELESIGASPQLIHFLHLGYPKYRAMKALQLSNNNISKATEYLVLHQPEYDAIQLEKQQKRDLRIKKARQQLQKIQNTANEWAIHHKRIMKDKIKGNRRTHEENVDDLLQTIENDLWKADRKF